MTNRRDELANPSRKARTNHRGGSSSKPAAIKSPRKVFKQESGTANQNRFLALVTATYPMRPSSVSVPANSASMFGFFAT
jgi:hypothetical protein